MLENIKRPVMGWICSYVPEEIIYAAGFHSYRIIGDNNQVTEADSFIPCNICSFTRNIADSALQGKYYFIQGIILTNSCIACEVLYSIWEKLAKTHFVYMLDVPRKADTIALEYFKNNLIELTKKIENHYGVSITDESLIKTVTLFNTTSLLLQEIYNLRKADHPPVSGKEMLRIMILKNTLPREEYNQYLKSYIQSIDPQKEEKNKNRKRILLMGSKIFSPDIIEIIEDDMGVIVYEDLCSVQKSFDTIVEIDEDILGAISRRYLHKTPCPRMVDTGNRIKSIFKKIEEYGVEGVIYHSIKFCSFHTLKGAEIREQLQAMGIPFLFIESDYSSIHLEQIRTRITTFLEII